VSAAGAIVAYLETNVATLELELEQQEQRHQETKANLSARLREARAALKRAREPLGVKA
jgi:multidrug efflux pump subunit AcrA (membrane-fusion protein)